MALTPGVHTKFTKRAVGAVVATALATTGLIGAIAPAQAKTVRVPTYDQTSLTEAKRVDSVPTPKLGWYKCYDYAQCATVKLPMDYDKPKGAKTEIALLRVKATDPKHRIGSLFVNPGGPGGSGTQMAYDSDQFLSESVTSRFDIVGIDPRGTNFSDNVRCFATPAAQAPVLDALAGIAFPYTKKEEAKSVAASKTLGKACSTIGKPLSASMSTAQVARDMDVIRRAVGDSKLNYLGFSYGTYLGQVYANMFPDRIRAVAIDGVIDPIGWAGTKATANQPSTDRIRSADGATKALHEILVRCDKAGGQLCAFAPGNPVKNFDVVAGRLKAHPLVFEDPFEGVTVTFRYSDLIGTTLGDLYYPDGSDEIAAMMSDLIILTEPPALNVSATKAAFKAAKKDLSKRLAAEKKAKAASKRFGFPYDNSIEAFTSVLCTDGLNPADASAWPAAAAAADKRAKYFGRLWTWSSSPCASKTWTATDEDRYHGAFTHDTINPVLVVGNYWDPATNYNSAVKVAGLLPNSRLLSSNSWGHTAYGTSECVTEAVDNFLLKVKLPAKGTTCVGDAQPFTGGGGDDDFLNELNRPLGGGGGGRPAPIAPVLPRY
jgi:pimeloyl-ACP methyl ester carboxylesterase